MNEVVIVDNAVYSFGFQLDNGIPIIPFKFDKNDVEFVHLRYYLTALAEAADTRECNKSVFKLYQIWNSNLESFIEYYSDGESSETSEDEDEYRDDLSSEEE